MNNLPAVPTGFSALSPQQQVEHRAKIGVRVRSILRPFWIDLQSPDAEIAMELEGWMDVLQNCSHSEIRFAWRDYMIDKKNRTASGRLRKPDAGAIYAIILSKRPRPKLVDEPVQFGPKLPRVTKEQTAEIIEQYGFAPKRF